MKSSVKNMKRRSLQKLLSKKSNAEFGLEDEEFDFAVNRFHALEKQCSRLVKELKEAKRQSDRYAQIHASLGSYMSLPFAEPGNPEASQGHEAFRVKSAYGHAHGEISKACMYVLQKRGIDVLEALLRDYFPSRKKLIHERAGLKLDVESYARRVQALQEKKQGNDKTLQKFVLKYNNAQERYNVKHHELRQDLNDFYHRRFEYLEPVYAAFVATQYKYHSYLTDFLDKFVKEGEEELDEEGEQQQQQQQQQAEGSSCHFQIQEARDAIESILEQGGPPEEPSSPPPGLFVGVSQKLFGTPSQTTALAPSATLPPKAPSSIDPSLLPTPPALPFSSMAQVPTSPGPGPSSPPVPDPQSPSILEERQQDPLFAQSPVDQNQAELNNSNNSIHHQQHPYTPDSGGSMPNQVQNDERDFLETFSDPVPPLTASPVQDPSQAEEDRRGSNETYVETEDDDVEEHKKESPMKEPVGEQQHYQSPSLSPSSPTPSPRPPNNGPDDSLMFDLKTLNNPPTATEILEMVVAAYDFETEDDADLAFKKGETIAVIEKDDENWWKGRIGNREGMFPVNYVTQK